MRASSSLVTGGASLVLSAYPNAPMTGGTTETNVGVARIPANTLGPNGRLHITSLWSFPSSANGKPITTRYANTSGAVSGGLAIVTAGFTNMSSAQMLMIIRNAGVTNIQNVYPNAGPAPYGTATAGGIGGGIDTSLDSFVNFNATLVLGTETITLLGYSVDCYRD